MKYEEWSGIMRLINKEIRRDETATPWDPSPCSHAAARLPLCQLSASISI